MADTEKVQDISSLTVSASVLAKIIGVTTDRRVRSLAQEGIFVKAAQGRYKLMDSMHNYILNMRVANDAMKTHSELEDELDLNSEKAKHERIKRHITELKLALMKGKVHKSEDVEAVMTDMLTNFKTKVLSLPSKLTPQLVNRDKSYILDLLTNEFTELLSELAEYNPADFYGKEYVDADDSEDDQENDDEEEYEIPDDYEELDVND